MNKKLLAVAVAGTFLAPAAALAQSSVTISGKAVASFGVYKVGNQVANAGRSSETQVRDEASTLIFSMREDLGGGLAAIAKYDLRPSIDTGNLSAQGEDFVGLTSPAWGTIQMGRFPMHYGAHASFTGVHSGLMSNPIALFDSAGTGAVAGTVPVARQSRMNDVIRYGSPKFADMFEIVVMHTTSAVGSGALPIVSGEADLRSFNRKGSGWNLAPKIWGKNWEAGYSYWTAKPDVGGALATTTKQRGDSLYGWYKWGGLRVGLAYNKSKIDTSTAAGVTTTTSNRTTWGIPISYNWGNHTIYGDFYRAGNDKAIAAGSTKARLFGVTYAYDLSKRTAIAVSYAGIRNQANAAYNLFTGNGGLQPGEDPSTWNVVMGHRF